MDAKAREIDIIFRKLHMDTRNTNEVHGVFMHEGVPILRTRRSFGNSKYVPADKIRCQLKVNEQQFAGLISCSVTKEDYIQILIGKHIIVPKQGQPSTGQPPKDTA
jgi:hypothetical protein